MDNQDQRTTHTQGQEGHRGVLAWNKKIRGTIEGYKSLVSERQAQSNEEHTSDCDPYIQGPNSLDTGNNDKVNVGTEEILNRSGDEVYLDARANFSDGAPSPGSKEPLRDSLNSATDVEITNIKYQDFSGYSDFNDVNQLIDKSTYDGQMQDPNILQSEGIKEGNMREFQGQLPGSHVDPLSSSIKGLKNFMLIDDYFSVSSDSNPSKAEWTPDTLLANKNCAGENVRRCSLASVAKENNLKENDEIKSDSESKTVGDTSEGTLKIAVGDLFKPDCKVSPRDFNLEEKNNVEFLSATTQEELLIEENSALNTNTSTNNVKVESAHTMQFATSGDIKLLQEMGGGNFNAFISPICDDRIDVAHPKNECVDFKDHKGALPQISLSLPSSEALKPKHDDLSDSDDEDNYLFIKQRKLHEKREVLPSDGDVLDSSTKKHESRELVAEEDIGVPSAKFMTESDNTSDEIGASMNCMKIEMGAKYMMRFFEESRSGDAHKNSQVSSITASEENPIDISFRGKCRVANVEDDIESSLKNQFSNLHLEVKPSSVVYKSDGVVEMDKFEKCDISDAQYMERPTVKDSSLPKPAGSNFECSICSEVVMDMSARELKSIECANKSPLSDAEEDNEINNSCRVNKERNGFISTSANSHQTQDAEAELLVKAAEDLGLPSNLKEPKAESERQKCEKPEMVMNRQHASFTSSQAGWFPTLTQVTNESQGIIDEINHRTSKQHSPLQSPLSEAAHSNKHESPKLEENSMIRKNSESSAAEAGKGSNSPADMKGQNKKVKRKPYWMPFICCSSVDSP